MDEQEIIRLYKEEMWTLRRVADRFGTNHHKIRRILQRHDIPISAKHRRAPMPEERRRRISERNKGRRTWNKGLKLPESSNRKNMKAKLKTGIDLDRYRDFERLKLLTRLLSKQREYLGGDDPAREAFLDHFYFDEAFNAVYDAWIESGKDKWYYPSLDHKDSLASGGGWGLNNLCFITWFENRAKAEMSEVQWAEFKRRTNTKSDLFIEAILGRHRNRGVPTQRRADQPGDVDSRRLP